MKVDNEELIAILALFNPWWKQEEIADLPSWRRAAFNELYTWITNPPTQRAIMLSGARQVGKTTLIMQTIDSLIRSGVPASNILYATFDHPILKLAGIQNTIDAWRMREPKKEGMEYVFLDEAQFISEWGTWIKHQTDFNKKRRVIFTGSALPLVKADQESGVGRWHTIKLTTLSFYEYLKLKQIDLPSLPHLSSLKELFSWSESELYRVQEIAMPYVAHYHQYLVRGGFPQTTLVETVTQSQKLLREDIIDKVLKRDMTALFGVRRILDLEHTFFYLCLHDGAILKMQSLCKELEIPHSTAQNFIELLESTHLIYRLMPFGYGKEVLRGKSKVYLSDPAITPAVLMKGKSALDDPKALGVSAESSVLKHLYSRYYSKNIKFSYWRNKKGLEVDLVAEFEGEIVPFEVKYRTNKHKTKQVNGLVEFCKQKKASRAYIITKALSDIGSAENNAGVQTFRIPATLLCYWMGAMEVGD